MTRTMSFSFFIVAATLASLCPTVFAQSIKSIERASLAPGSNAQGESYSYDARISGDGRYVTFTSTADNFPAEGSVPGKFHEHLYLRDTLTGVTSQVDVTSAGRTGSPGGDFNPNIRVFRSSFRARISRDSKYLVFTSIANDLTNDQSEPNNGAWAYLKNLESGELIKLPTSSRGDLTRLEYPTYLAINADGSKVIVISIVANLGDPEGTRSTWELTVYDRNTNSTRLINTGIVGNKFNPDISDDGRFVVFDNQVDGEGAAFTGPTYAYLYDLTLNQATQLNDGKTALSPTISGDGAFIAYSDSSVVPTRVRLRERESGSETLVSGGFDGSEPSGISSFPSLNQDGRYVAFLSTADNLVADDGNGTDDIFVYDRVTQKTTLVSVQGTCKGISTREDFNTGPPSISSDGTRVTFNVLERLIAADTTDEFGNIERADTNSFDDVYVGTVDYNVKPTVFKKGLTPTTPFATVNCSGEEARLQVQSILSSSKGSSVSGQKGSIKATPVKRVTQDLIISTVLPSGRQAVRQKLVVRRNVVTTRGLPAGNYVAQVQARAVLKNGVTTKSRVSKGARFTIGN